MSELSGVNVIAAVDLNTPNPIETTMNGNAPKTVESFDSVDTDGSGPSKEGEEPQSESVTTSPAAEGAGNVATVLDPVESIATQTDGAEAVPVDHSESVATQTDGAAITEEPAAAPAVEEAPGSSLTAKPITFASTELLTRLKPELELTIKVHNMSGWSLPTTKDGCEICHLDGVFPIRTHRIRKVLNCSMAHFISQVCRVDLMTKYDHSVDSFDVLEQYGDMGLTLYSMYKSTMSLVASRDFVTKNCWALLDEAGMKQVDLELLRDSRRDLSKGAFVLCGKFHETANAPELEKKTVRGKIRLFGYVATELLSGGKPVVELYRYTCADPCGSIPSALASRLINLHVEAVNIMTKVFTENA